MTPIYLDVETRSGLELPDVGADQYLAHPWADIWCLGYAVGDAPVQVVSHPYDVMEVANEIALSGKRIVAHNAVFEYLVWNYILDPKYFAGPLPPARFECTMAAGYAMSLPGSLDDLSAALGIEAKKDMAGSRLAKQMSKPRRIDEAGNPIWWDEPEKLQRLMAYCAQDIEVLREVHRRVVPLSDYERRTWIMDFGINRRGVYTDQPAIHCASSLVTQEQGAEMGKLFQLTGGLVHGPSEVKKLTEWIQAQGVEIPGLAKQDVIDTLSTDDLPAHVREALTIRQNYAKTSTAKLGKMRHCAGTDGRVRGILQYHASSTGRWGGRMIQPQNLPRPTISQEDIDDIIDRLQTATPEEAAAYIKVFHGPPIARVADCLRGMLRAAPGKQLYVGDFANIEGRVLAWLAGEEWKVQAFRDFDEGKGPDLYLVSAARIFHKPVASFNKKSPERMIGKVSELALGYQGGQGAFQTMAHTYGVKVSDTEAEQIKKAWRSAHPKIQQYWWDVETAAIRAVQTPGVVFRVRTVAFAVRGSFLWCQLPSGRRLCYPYPTLEDKDTLWGEVKPQVVYKTVDDRTRQWGRTSTYGGKLAENITQAVARDILVDRMHDLELHSWNIVLHVHDEIVAEDTPDRDLAEYLGVMRKQPHWAPDLPLAVEGWAGTRYKK